MSLCDGMVGLKEIICFKIESQTKCLAHELVFWYATPLKNITCYWENFIPNIILGGNAIF
jgi:hypothetical protein